MHGALEIIDSLENIGIVPVVKLENTANAVKLAAALRAGGINCAEITYRAAGAKNVIADIARAFPDMLVGAGTVLTVEQADEALAAGAKFIVAPGLNERVVSHVIKRGALFIPGVATSGEIEKAIELGLKAVKFFPAEQAGGLNYIKAVSAPYSGIRFMPTGGINENNLCTYLAFDKIIACGGSWMVSEELIKNERFSDITAACTAAVNKMLGFEFAHLGIGGVDAEAESALLNSAFGLEVKNGNSSIFVSKQIELSKNDAPTHIAIGTNSLKRAVYALKTRGYEIDESSYKYDANKRPVAVYLANKFCGMKLHLLQK